MRVFGIKVDGILGGVGLIAREMIDYAAEFRTWDGEAHY